MDSFSCLHKLFFRICYVSIIVFFVVVIILSTICVVKILYPSISINDYAQLITATTALFAFVIAVKEYYAGKDSKQAQVLSEYNKRFSEDLNVVKVVKYLNYIDDNGTNNNPVREKPSNYEVEMFMRFFEELELQINNKRLNKEDVFDLFIYYANKLYTNKPLLDFLGVTDISNNWKRYEKLMKDYDQYNKKN